MKRTTGRRAMLALMGMAPLGLTLDSAWAQTQTTPPKHQANLGPVEAAAGRWKTWVLESGSQLRLPQPPSDSATDAESGELRDLAARRDAAALDQVAYWDAGSPGYRWNEIACAAGMKG